MKRKKRRVARQKKERKMLKHIFVVSIIVMAVLTTAYYSGQQQGKNLAKQEHTFSSTSPKKIYSVPPTITPTTTPIPISEWATYKVKGIEFQYPAMWSLRTYNYGTYSTSGLFIIIQDDVEYPRNTFSIEFTQLALTEVSKNETVEELIEAYKKYDVFSTASWGNYKPVEKSKTVQTVSGKVAYEYVFQLEEVDHLTYDTVTYIFIPIKTEYLILRIYGTNDEILKKIRESIQIIS